MEVCNACESDDDSVDPAELRVIHDDVTNEYVALLVDDSVEPKGFKDATSGPMADRWWESMRSEIEALLKNKTWTYVSRNDPRLKGRPPTKSRWVYKISRTDTCVRCVRAGIVGALGRARYLGSRSVSAVDVKLICDFNWRRYWGTRDGRSFVFYGSAVPLIES